LLRERRGPDPTAADPRHQKTGEIYFDAFAEDSGGVDNCLAGKLQEAIASLELGIKRDAQVGSRAWTSMAHAHLAEAYAIAGRPADALSMARVALAIAQEQLQLGPEAWAHYALAISLARALPADIEGAVASMRDCLRLADRLSMRPLAANAHHRLGELYAKMANRTLPVST
jgi:hypothetical protein